MKSQSNNRGITVLAAFLFTLGVLSVGYFSFVIWTTFIFASGFLGGFII